jgi:hypothetical protein
LSLEILNVANTIFVLVHDIGLKDIGHEVQRDFVMLVQGINLVADIFIDGLDAILQLDHHGLQEHG